MKVDDPKLAAILQKRRALAAPAIAREGRTGGRPPAPDAAAQHRAAPSSGGAGSTGQRGRFSAETIALNDELATLARRKRLREVRAAPPLRVATARLARSRPRTARRAAGPVDVWCDDSNPPSRDAQAQVLFDAAVARGTTNQWCVALRVCGLPWVAGARGTRGRWRSLARADSASSRSPPQSDAPHPATTTTRHTYATACEWSCATTTIVMMSN